MSDIIDEIFNETKNIEHRLNSSIEWCINKTVTPPLQKLCSFEVSRRTFADLTVCADSHFALVQSNAIDGKNYLFGVPVHVTKDPLIDQDKPYYRAYFKQA